MGHHRHTIPDSRPHGIPQPIIAHGPGHQSDYEKGYRDGYYAATGHFPNCPRVHDHMQGAETCSACGSRVRGG